MPGCFINYRTGDGEHVATLIDRELGRRFGPDEVFRAGRSIEAGQDYVRSLDEAVRRCEVLVAIIGPAWLGSPDRSEATGRALDDPDDWTRREIATALSLGTPVIPVLFDGVARLRPSDLPEEVHGLARCQYRRFDHRSTESDLADVIEAVEVAVPRLGEFGRPPAVDSDERSGSGTANTARDVHGGTLAQAGDFHGINGIDGHTRDVVFGNSGPVNTGAGAQYNGSTVHNGTGDQIGVQHVANGRGRGEAE